MYELNINHYFKNMSVLASVGGLRQAKVVKPTCEYLNAPINCLYYILYKPSAFLCKHYLLTII